MLDPTEPFRADVKPQPGHKLDLTLWGCGTDLVAKLRPDVSACLNFCCPLEADKSVTVNLDACADLLWGKAKWTVPAGGVNLETTPNTNTVIVSGTKGTVKVCGSVRDDVAGCWLIDVDPQASPICTPSALDASKCQKDRR